MRPVLPDYEGACLHRVVPVLLGVEAPPPWLPAIASGAERVVLLVIDGLGWEQLQDRKKLAPTLSSMEGGPILTVAPSTTATALTSLTTGTVPAVHGVLGYRLRVGPDVLNVLRWRTSEGDARTRVPPGEFQTVAPFAGTRPPVVTRTEFSDSGFSGAHLAGVRHQGWRMPSTLITATAQLMRAGEPFVYAYYDGVDKIAHEFGFGEFYDSEIAATDRVVSALLDVMPPDVVVVVTSDHGQVDVGDNIVPLDREVMDTVALLSGEGRFRWLHARPGMAGRLLEVATRHHGDEAWVRSREAMIEEGWFGGRPEPLAADRLGDVALAAKVPVAFLDPADVGESRMRCRHGSLTEAEMRIPLLATRT